MRHFILLVALFVIGLATVTVRAQIRDDTEAASQANSGRVVMRRLNRTEFENSVCELLGIQVELKDLLPLDNSAGGFDNVGDALHVSSFLMD
jgi:hypothetical protein